HLGLRYCCHRGFLFNAPPTAAIYALSLHDALPIYGSPRRFSPVRSGTGMCAYGDGAMSPYGYGTSPPPTRTARATSQRRHPPRPDRKSTRLNSSHVKISYAVFCLKKKMYINDIHHG